MTYGKTWSTEAQSAADSYFIYKREFQNTLRELESKNWSLVEHRQQAFDIWNGMHREFVVNFDKQFPEHRFYISTEECEFPKIASQLEAALSYKESSKHRNEPAKEPSKQTAFNTKEIDHIGNTLITFASDDDARKAYYESIRTFYILARTAGCGFDRGGFESKFSLTWTS